MNREETEKHPLIVTYAGRHYDISGFSKRHPGGERVLRMVAGANVDSFIDGTSELLGLRHKHSKAAYEILARYSLDQEFKRDPLVDNKAPMLWRVGELRERYWTWIHHPYDGVLRLFESELLERLTRTKWWVIPLLWLPVVSVFFFSGLPILREDFGPFGGTFLGFALFCAGSLAWTLLEYSLHRGLFHWHPNPQSYRQITLHFLLHGLHHKTPMDSDRLVFPPAAALLIVCFFYAIYRILLPFPFFCCFASGKLFGYIVYDITHYYLHHGRPEPNSRWHYRKVYHHNHHFKDSDSSFGISTTFWDCVFGTLGVGAM
uniref:Fatty acid 2-hydroxylase n=1 Tax=Globodera rostochiensis TaxID=31243 RepID=A0A914HNK2_GLORO